MADDSYVLMHTKVKCSKGCIENYLNVGTDHGVCKMEGDSKYPILNCNDNNVTDNITDFGECCSEINRDYQKMSWIERAEAKAKQKITKQGLCKCVPEFITPWINTNLKAKLENGEMLTSKSSITCSKGGGIITIVTEEQ